MSERILDANLDAVQYRPEWPSCELTDFSKLTIAGGRLHFKLYRQDGTFQAMAVADTDMNRRYVSWMQIHDRYTPRATGEGATA